VRFDGKRVRQKPRCACDGVNVGRVYQVDAGQQEGLWQWSRLWVGNDTRGTVETLDEVLEAALSH
jgi:hypothetical protein